MTQARLSRRVLRVTECLNGPVWEPVRFAIVGGLNTVAGLGVIYAAKYLLRLDDIPANILGYAVGLTISFHANSRWTFNYTGRRGPAAARFLVVFLCAYLCNLATLAVLVHGLEVNGYIAQALSIPPYTVCFYLLSKYLAFRPARQP